MRKSKCPGCRSRMHDGDEGPLLTGACRACELEAISRGLDGKTAMHPHLGLAKRRGADGEPVSFEQKAPWVGVAGDGRGWSGSLAEHLRALVLTQRQAQAEWWRAQDARDWRAKQRMALDARLGRRGAALEKVQHEIDAIENTIAEARDQFESAEGGAEERKAEAQVRKVEAERDLKTAELELARAEVEDQYDAMRAEAQSDAREAEDA